MFINHNNNNNNNNSGVRPHTITFCACACNNGTRKRGRPGFRGYDVARRKRGPSRGYLARAPHAFVAYAELAANGVVYCLPGEYSEIYRRREEQERKERFVTVHNSADVGGV